MDQDDGKLVLALEASQVGEQCRDFTGVILVDAVQPDQGIEQQQVGLERLDGLLQPSLVGGEVESQAVRGYDVDLLVSQGELAVPSARHSRCKT